MVETKYSFGKLVLFLFSLSLLWINMMLFVMDYLGSNSEDRNGLIESGVVTILNQYNSDIDIIFYGMSRKDNTISLTKPIEMSILNYTLRLKSNSEIQLNIPLTGLKSLLVKKYDGISYLGAQKFGVPINSNSIIISDDKTDNVNFDSCCSISRSLIALYFVVGVTYFLALKYTNKYLRRMLYIFAPVVLLDIYHILKMIELILIY